KVDAMAPTLTFQAPTTAANTNGWYNGDISVPFTASDATSGLVAGSPTGPVVIATEGAAVHGSVTLTDQAGNSATFTTTDFRLDKSKPTLGAAPTAAPNGTNGWYTSDVTVHFSTADQAGLSGIDAATVPADQVLTGEGAAVKSTAPTVAD